jgi:hypothetical protein
VDARRRIRDHFVMPAYPRCGALLRNGQPCGRTVEAGSEFCVHHTRLLEDVDVESLRQGRIPKKRTLNEPTLRVVDDVEAEPMTTTMTVADPANVRPSLALAAAENLDALKGLPPSRSSIGDQSNLDHGRVLELRRAVARRGTRARCSRSRRGDRAPAPGR